MDAKNSKNAVAFMSRHFVALACEYDSLNPDGTIFHSGRTVLSGFLIELHDLIFWATAGHCLKDELDKPIDAAKLRITSGGFVDYLGHEASYYHMVPFTYEPHSALYVEEPEQGLDFALLLLDELQVKAFAANKIVPITRENWVHQPRLTFDFYRMLGIPANQVSIGQNAGEFNVQQVMIAVNRLNIDEIGEPPRGVEVPSDAWFVGQIDPGAEIRDIEGMSGGPIFGFRKHDDGKLTYHVVALQSRWWDKSQIIFGCSMPYFAEAVYVQLDDFIHARQ